jgi:Holliday junction resolvase RusA-like endonuclease
MTAALSLTFNVPGKPVAFARARSCGKRRFTPQPQSNYMAVVRLLAQNAMRGRAPILGPVSMTVHIKYERPASWSAKQKAATFWKTSTPDADNVAKIVADALKGVAWVDDAQVARLVVEKYYAAAAGVSVNISSLSENAIA